MPDACYDDRLVCRLVRHDLLPPLTIACLYRDGTVVDLTDATAPRFLMKHATGSGTDLKVDSPATILDAPGGIMRYSWAGTDTDTVGTYKAEFEVTISGMPITFPGGGQTLTVVIRADLG